MPELKLVSPLLDGMESIRCVASSGGTSLYLVRHRLTGETFMVKHISIPESQTQVEALLITGGAANEEEAQRYYEQVTADYEDQLKALGSLKGTNNCATYLDYQVCAREEGVGFDLYVLSSRYVTLPMYLNENAMTHLRALNLGLDLCTALQELRARDLIHRDIKPENIYLNALGGFMVGDLGAARISQLKFCPMPEHMISEYTAPEIADAIGDLNTTVDIYSVGMVLYRILNGNHGPFEDENTSAKAANKLRIGGEPLPTPLYADYELAAIVLKACAFEPADRYQTPDEMLQELMLYMKRNTVRDSLIVPPLITGDDMLVSADEMEEPVEPVRFADVKKLDEQFVDSFSPAEVTAPPPEMEELDLETIMDEPEERSPVFAAPHTKHVADDEPEAPAPEEKPAERPKKKKKRAGVWIPILIILLLLAGIGLGAWYLLFGGPAVNILDLSVTDRGVDYLTVDLTLEKPGETLRLSCADAQGSVAQQDYSGQSVTIHGLEPGTQYTISVTSPGGRRLTGPTSTTATTVATTQIAVFSVTPAQTGQAELHLAVSGPNPGEWTVRYSADGGEAKEIAFTGGSATIFNLEPNRHYTFTLLEPEGIVLQGMAVTELTTEPAVEITDLRAIPISGNAVRATWSCEGEAPNEWSVTCTASDGTARTQFASECRMDFGQLTSGETYTITVSAPGVKEPVSVSVMPVAAEVTGISARATASDSAHVSWESDQPNGEWLLRVTPKGSDNSELVKAAGSETDLTDLVPGVTYELELRSARDEPLGENAATEVALAAPGKFSDYGVEKFFLGSFLLPSKANWSRNDLNPGVAEFKPGQKMVVAVNSYTEREESDERVKVTILVEEDKSGALVSAKSYTETWDKLWESGIIIGVVDDMPAKPGDYVVRLYLNNKTTSAKEFKVIED